MRHQLTAILLSAIVLSAAAEDTCSLRSAAQASTSPYIELTHALSSRTWRWGSTKGLGEYRQITNSPDKGDVFTASLLTLPSHLATHVDAPCHFVPEKCHPGKTLEALPLDALIGPAVVVEVPPVSNITAKVMRSLKIPAGTKRLIFKTDSTTKGLMHKTPFDSAYTAMTADGSEWAVEHLPNLILLAIDYASIAVYPDQPGVHVPLLSKDIVIVEGLVLDEVPTGALHLICLPPRLEGLDGGPIRCVAQL